MSADFDYDEIDQAVTNVMGDETPQEMLVADEAEDTSVRVSVNKPKPKPRGLYMDMVGRKPISRPATSIPSNPPKPPTPKPAPTKVEHTTEFGVIEDVLPPSNSFVGSAAEADFIEEPTPFKSSTSSPTPNPENFTLGGRSPFIESAMIEKRPLGDHIPDSNPLAVHSTKNIYSSRSVANRRPTEEFSTHEIIDTPKRKSGLGRFFIVLFVILIGAVTGAVAWFLLSSDVKLF